MKKTIAVLLMFFSMGALGTEFKPYTLAEITTEQWTSYFEKVSQAFPKTAQDHPEQHLIVYFNNKDRLSYAFTKEGHPAHPAWVTRQVVESEETIDMVQIGYFAGKEEPFAVLFQQYQQLTEQNKASMRASSK
jgi:hypothetical protein